MGYAQALDKAWRDISTLRKQGSFQLKLLGESYSVDPDKKEVSAGPHLSPAKEYTAIILLHYLKKSLSSEAGLKPSGEWIDFNQLEGGEEYYTTFRKRTIDRIIKKYGSDPLGLVSASARLPSAKNSSGDVGCIIYPFDNVPILITIWRGDEEFGPDANILFDPTIKEIFCTEDIVVLTEIVVHSL